MERSGPHSPRVVMVTGASRYLSCQLVGRLAEVESIDRVIAVDIKSPSTQALADMGRAEFVRADISNPLIGKVIADYGVDTLVYSSTIPRPPKGGSRAAMKDQNVLGAMQVFGSCQKSPSIRKIVLRSSTAVYGASAKDPVKFSEEMTSRAPLRGPFAIDTVDVESFARGVARRRPDITLTTLRLSPLVGPRLNGAAARYFAGPVVPLVLGRDARLQLLHEEDALAALEHATVAGRAGTFNVAGDGVLMLSQAIRRAGLVGLPMPFSLFRGAGRLLMDPVMRGFTQEQLDFYNFGCGLDTSKMRAELGFAPRWTTIQAFDDFVRGSAMRPAIDPKWIDWAENRLLDLVGTRARGPHEHWLTPARVDND